MSAGESDMEVKLLPLGNKNCWENWFRVESKRLTKYSSWLFLMQWPTWSNPATRADTTRPSVPEGTLSSTVTATPRSTQLMIPCPRRNNSGKMQYHKHKLSLYKKEPFAWSSTPLDWHFWWHCCPCPETMEECRDETAESRLEEHKVYRNSRGVWPLSCVDTVRETQIKFQQPPKESHSLPVGISLEQLFHNCIIA